MALSEVKKRGGAISFSGQKGPKRAENGEGGRGRVGDGVGEVEEKNTAGTEF